MNCSETQVLLSAFYDGELSSDVHAAVASHLDRCSACAESLAGYEQLSGTFARSAAPAVPPSVWAGVVRRLDNDRAVATESEVSIESRDSTSVELASSGRNGQSQGRGWSRAASQRLAIAAAMLFVLGLGVWMSRHDSMSGMDHEHHKEFVATMDQYLRALPNNPGEADQFLLNKYDGQVVSPEQAVRLVGYRPAVADGLPVGYLLASTSVLKMPCCTCVKAVCRRSDGSTLVLFEHNDENPTWFGDRASRMAMCGDIECCLVDLDSSIAASWRIGTRSLTAVGARDQAEVTALVDWLKQS